MVGGGFWDGFGVFVWMFLHGFTFFGDVGFCLDWVRSKWIFIAPVLYKAVRWISVLQGECILL